MSTYSHSLSSALSSVLLGNTSGSGNGNGGDNGTGGLVSSETSSATNVCYGGPFKRINTTSVINRCKLPLTKVQKAKMNRISKVMENIKENTSYSIQEEAQQAISLCQQYLIGVSKDYMVDSRMVLGSYYKYHKYNEGNENSCGSGSGVSGDSLDVWKSLDIAMHAIVNTSNFISTEQKMLASQLYNWLQNSSSTNYPQLDAMAIAALDYIGPLFKKCADMNNMDEIAGNMVPFRKGINETYQKYPDVAKALRNLRYIIKKHQRYKNKMSNLFKTKKQVEIEKAKKRNNNKKRKDLIKPLARARNPPVLTYELLHDHIIPLFNYFVDTTPEEDGLQYKFSNIDKLERLLNAEFVNKMEAAYNMRVARRENYKEHERMREEKRQRWLLKMEANKQREKERHEQNQNMPVSKFNLDGEMPHHWFQEDDDEDEYKYGYDEDEDEDDDYVIIGGGNMSNIAHTNFKVNLLGSNSSHSRGHSYRKNTGDNDDSGDSSDDDYTTSSDNDSYGGSWADNNDLEGMFSGVGNVDSSIPIVTEHSMQDLDQHLNQHLDSDTDDNLDDDLIVRRANMRIIEDDDVE